MVSNTTSLAPIDGAPAGEGHRVVLVVDAPRGLDLDRIGNLVHKLLGEDVPTSTFCTIRGAVRPSPDKGARRRSSRSMRSVVGSAMAGVISPMDKGAAERPSGPADAPELTMSGRPFVAEDDR